MARNILIAFSLVAAMTFTPALQSTASARIELSDIDAQNVKIEQRGNSIIVIGAAGQTVHIYDLVAVEKKTVVVDGSEKRIDLSQLPKGIYLVKVGNESKKILLR